MKESPIYTEIKSAGMTSAAPLKEAFTKWPNLKQVLISLFGATAGQGVVWYTGQFFALIFLTTFVKLNPRTANIIVAVALLLGMPFFTVFGALSDKIGRKKIMMAGCLLAVICYYPIYGAMQKAAGNNVETFKSQTNPATKQVTLTALARDAAGNLKAAPEAPNPQFWTLVLLVWIQVVFVTMVYGPIAAFLVEAFPAKIRYTSLSLPYHIGNGVFGGLVPLVATYVCAATGNIYSGLWYPMAIASITFVVGSIFLKETRHVQIWTEVAEAKTTGR
jgi:MFS family permease